MSPDYPATNKQLGAITDLSLALGKNPRDAYRGRETLTIKEASDEITRLGREYEKTRLFPPSDSPLEE